MMTELPEDSYRAPLAWLRAVVTNDREGLRVVARSVEPAALINGVTFVTGLLPFDAADPEGWVNRTFDRIGEITLAAEPPTTTDPPEPAAAITTSSTTPITKDHTMIKPTISLADQRRVLSQMTGADDPGVSSNYMFPRDYVDTSELLGLARSLRALGVVLEDADKFDVLRTAVLPKPETPAGRRLDWTPAALSDHAREVVMYDLVRVAVGRAVQRHVEAAGRELLRSMIPRADEFISAFRPSFSSAIGDFTKAVDLGLTTYSTAGHAISLGPDAVAAWSLTQESARVLDSVAGVRKRISRALGIAPVNLEPHGPRVTYGIAFGSAEYDKKHVSSWQRWMAVATSGTARLLTVPEVEAAIAERQAAVIAAKNEARIAEQRARSVGPMMAGVTTGMASSED